jgi:geranylgeranyl pyrophosphate synthase
MAHPQIFLSQPQTLMEPFSYITSTPGKDFRGGMMQAFNAWLDVPKPTLQVIGRVVAMLHNASLLCAKLPFCFCFFPRSSVVFI